MPIDVAVWYASVTRQIEVQQQQQQQFNRQAPARSSGRSMYTPPSPSLRRVTSEPPPIPPRTPESQRKPLLVRLASEPVAEGLDFQAINGRVTVVDRSKQQQQPPPSCFQFDPLPKPSGGGFGSSNSSSSSSKPSPPVSAGASGGPGPGGFRFNLPLRPPTLPPRPPPAGSAIQPSASSPSDEIQPPPGKVFMSTNSVHPASRLMNPPTDLPGLPPRPPPSTFCDASGGDRSNSSSSSSSSVARLAQMFGTQLSPAKSPTSAGKDPYEAFNMIPPAKQRSTDGGAPPIIPPRLSPESSHPPPSNPVPPPPAASFSARSLFSDGLMARISQDPNLARFFKSSSVDHSANNRGSSNGHQQMEQPQRSFFGRRISSDGASSRRWSLFCVI